MRRSRSSSSDVLKAHGPQYSNDHNTSNTRNDIAVPRRTRRPDRSPAATALAAGRCWQEYRKAGGSRERVIADFLIGAHAAARADRLLTRDRGFYRNCFPGLPILDPSGGPASR